LRELADDRRTVENLSQLLLSYIDQLDECTQEKLKLEGLVEKLSRKSSENAENKSSKGPSPGN
jgi:uncharacterized coiled-coil protein SlyX